MPVSIFMFNQAGASSDETRMAQNFVKKLRSVRYPFLLKFLDTAEHQGMLYLVTEQVVPLAETLSKKSHGLARENLTDWLCWGLHHVAESLAFIHDKLHSVHGNVQPNSIFLSISGEWLLGGLETTSDPSENNALLLYLQNRPPYSNAYVPPEVQNGGWTAIRDGPVGASDSYSLCLTALEVFNGTLPSNMSKFAAGRVPAPLYNLLKLMALPDPRHRLQASEFVSRGMQSNGFLSSNVYLTAEKLLDEFRAASTSERNKVLTEMITYQERLSPAFMQMKILPVLTEAFQFKNGSSPSELAFSAKVLLPVMLQIGHNLDPVRWNMVLSAPIVGALQSQDPAMNQELVNNMELYVDYLKPKVICNELWSLVCRLLHSFNDAHRMVGLKSIFVLLPKLNDRILNNELLRELAKLQKDNQPLLRLKTIQLLSQLTSHLTSATKADVLIPAFGCSLRDSYDQTRLAGLSAFRDNTESFSAEVLAQRVIPAVSPCLVDSNADVRALATEMLQMYLNKISQYTESLDSVSTSMPGVIEEQVQDEPVVSRPVQKSGFSAFLTATAGTAATAIGEWAMAQIEEDEDPLSTQVTMGLINETSHAPEENLPDTPRMSPSPAVPLLKKEGMSLAKPGSKGSALNQLLATENRRPKEKIVPVLQSTKSASANRLGEALDNDEGAKLATSGSRPVPSVKADAEVRPSRPVVEKSTPAPVSAGSQSQTTKPIPTLAVRPSSTSVPRGPDKSDSVTAVPRPSALTQEEKMAQLARLREERRAVCDDLLT